MKIYKKHPSPQRGFSPLSVIPGYDQGSSPRLRIKSAMTIIFLPFRLLFALSSLLLALPFKLLFVILNLIQNLLPAKLMSKLSSTQRLFLNMVITAVILIFGVFIYTTMTNPEQTKAAWFDGNWLYRTSIPITNSSGSELTNYQILIATDTARMITEGKLQSDCDDIRITDQNGKILPHWIETGAKGCNTATTNIWVKVPVIPTSGGQLFLYYANTSAQNVQNGNKVFELFDDFSGNSLNSAKWTTGTIGATSGTDFTVGGGLLTGGNSNRTITSVKSFTGDYSAEARTYTTTPVVNGFTPVGFFASTSNGWAILDHNGTSYYRNDATWVNFGYSGNTQWTRNTARVVGTTGTYARVGETSGSVTSTGTNSGISGENIRLSARGDNLANDQSYAANWDWILVRKAVATEPTTSISTEEQSPAPVAYWKFDEGTGTVTSDSSSNKYNGTIIGGATWKQGGDCLSGKCLFFDGVDDYINVGSSSRYGATATTGSYTIEAWVKPTDVNRYNVVTRYIGGGDYFSAGVTGQSGWLRNMVKDTVGSVNYWPDTNKSAISANTWNHITFIYSTGVGYKYYVNGNLIRSIANTNIHFFNYAATAYLGIGTDANSYFKGYMDEVKVYPYERSANQVKLDYSSRGSVQGVALQAGSANTSALANGLVGYWKMDEASYNGTSGEVIDSSGNGNNGTTVSGAEASTSAKFGNAGYFAGIDESISLGTPTSMTSRTYSIWIKPNAGASANGRDGVFGEDGGTRIDYGNGTGSTSFHALVLLTSGSPNYKELTGTGNGTTGWSHLVLAINNTKGEATFYVNGLLTSTATWNTATQSVNTSGAQYLGYVNSAAKYAGNLDDARLYNRALTPVEVQQLYNFAPGPYAYLSFDDGSGSSIADKSGNGYGGTWNGSGSNRWRNGKYGKAGYFDGTTDYVSFSSLPNPSTNGPITIEMWVKSVSATPVGIFDSAPGVANVLRNYSAGNVEWWNSSPSVALGLSANTWTHIAFTFEFSSGTTRTLKYYKNGVLQSSSSTGVTPTYAWTTFRLGNINGGSAGWYTGLIDEFKIYNYARTPGQIVSDMNADHPLGGSPVGSQALYTKFDEGYGTAIHDSGPNRIDGTLTSATWSNDGKFGKTIKTNGASSYASITDNDAIDFAYNQDFTTSFWIRDGGGNSTDRSIIEKWDGSGGYPYVFRTTSNSIKIARYDGTNNPSVTGTKVITDGNWHHILGQKSGSTLYLYIDGIRQTTGTTDTTSGTTTNSSAVYIGARGGSGQFWNGYVDELKIYGAALSASEIKLEYNRGSSLVLGALGTSGDGKTASNSADSSYCVPGDTSTCSAPIAQYSFEEKSGASVQDISGNGNTATKQNTPIWVQGKIGSAMNFDDSADYLSVSGIAVGSSWTMSTWSKFPLAVNGGYRTLIRQGANLHHVLVDPSGLLGVYNGSFVSSGYDTDTTPAGWHHLTAVGTGGSTVFYLDGKLIGTSANQITGNITQIGGVGSQNWGAIDEMRIYNYARSAAQIAYDYNRGKPVAQWKMDECQGTTLNESMGSSMSATLTIGGSGTQTSAGTCSTASTAWGNGATGKFNYSLNFDHTDDWAILPDSISLAMNSFALSTWFKTTSAGDDKIFSLSGSYHPLQILSGKFRTCTNGCTAGNTTINDGLWHHAVVSGGASGITVYLDGKVEITQAASATTMIGVPRIGALGAGTDNTAALYFYGGQLDDVQMFNYGLTATQVKALMNQGSSVRFGPSTGTP